MTTLPLFDQPLPDDICARKHGGNVNSIAANERNKKVRVIDYERIKAQVAAAGFYGITINEMKLWDFRKDRWKTPNQYSGRLTAMSDPKIEASSKTKQFRIYEANRKRDNCEVYVNRPEWVTPKEAL